MMPKQQSEVGLGFPRSLLSDMASAEFGYHSILTFKKKQKKNSKVILRLNYVQICDNSAIRPENFGFLFNVLCLLPPVQSSGKIYFSKQSFRWSGHDLPLSCAAAVMAEL